jgi:hypothetical protein
MEGYGVSEDVICNTRMWTDQNILIWENRDLTSRDIIIRV